MLWLSRAPGPLGSAQVCSAPVGTVAPTVCDSASSTDQDGTMGLRTVEAALTGLLVACSSAERPSAQEMASMENGHDHMAYTATRPATAADTARALDVVQRLRASISRY